MKPPRKGCTLIRSTRPDNLPDGVHCGAWRCGTEVYKSLLTSEVNGWPSYRTQEDAFLEHNADLRFFPPSWRVEDVEGRPWLIRPWTPYIFDSRSKLRSQVSAALALALEQSVREVNRRGWVIQDALSLGYLHGHYFVVDASTAYHYQDRQGNADDTTHILRFFRWAGLDWLANWRSTARDFLFTDMFCVDYPQHRHVYGSFYRPIDRIWARRLPANTLFYHQERRQHIPHTWVITTEALPPDVIKSYELRWGWSPIIKRDTIPY